MSIIVPTGRFRGAEVTNAKRKHFEPEELRAFFAAAKSDPFWYAYFSLEYYYGLRVSEAAIILIEDVSFQTSEILIRRLKKKRFAYKLVEVDGKKRRVKDDSVPQKVGFDERTYGVPPKLLEVLGAVPHPDRNNPWFFASPRRPRKGTPTQRMSEIRRTAGYAAISRDTARLRFIHFSELAKAPSNLARTHALRHTRATLMLASGSKEEDVQYLLGHSSINITRQYIGVAKAMRLRTQTAAQLGAGDFLD